MRLARRRSSKRTIRLDEAEVIRDCAARMQKPIHGLTPSAERLLLNARWDGNVRELKNVIERACILADGTQLSERELEGAFGPQRGAQPYGSPGAKARVESRGAESSAGAAPLEEIEREHILEVLRQVNGNRMAAAKVLGISRRALYRRRQATIEPVFGQLFISGYTDSTTQPSLGNPNTSFLSKPFHAAALAARVAEMLERRP